jgi:predicted O-methyltransferase YrrM
MVDMQTAFSKSKQPVCSAGKRHVYSGGWKLMPVPRRLREQLKSGFHGLFLLGQRLGWDILPRHFYSAIPEIRELQRSNLWKRPSSMTGVAGAAIESQISFLRECCLPPLLERLKRGGMYEFACEENGEPGYGPVEAEFLYCFIMTKRPKRIVQVGCGVSTAVILLAAKEADYRPLIICVDPFPTGYLTRTAKRKLIELIPKPAQEVDLKILSGLNAGDLLFVDSTHAVRPGGEVNRIILEVLPRLQSGSFVHFHDIYFPYDYQSTVLTTLMFAGESTLLHAFLIYNQRYSIAVSLSMLHHACPQQMQSLLPNYRPAVMHCGLHTMRKNSGHFPSATYLSVL